jgi:maltodextrin utilization protein YvdJ
MVRLMILIVMLPVLHPHCKTSYFVKASWKHEWIKTAEDLVQQEWQSSYKPMVAMTALTTAMSTTAMSTV